MPQNIEFAYASFLIRLWRQTNPAYGAGSRDWQSEVDHIQSGQRWKFTTVDDLLNFLRQSTEDSEVMRSFLSGFE